MNNTSLVMVNRIVKQTEDGDTVNFLIKKLLIEKRELEFGDIREYLKQCGIEYSQKRGLYLRLNRLIEQGILEKSYSKNKEYPIYRLTKKEMIAPKTIGLFFKHSMDTEVMKIRGKVEEKEFLKFMTKLIGVYTMYMEIISWRLTSENKSYNDNLRIRKAFLDNALPITIPVYEGNEELNCDKSELFKVQRNAMKEILKFESILREMFPVQMIMCGAVHHHVEKMVNRLS